MDRTGLPITGYYSLGQYVIVHSEVERDKLKSLGYFGRNLDDIKKKQDHKRGPEDRRILDLVLVEDDESRVVLSLHEAFFLTYALGCLDIKSTEKEPIDIDTCWRLFREYNQITNLKTDFAAEFCVYFYFRTRGWVVKSGSNYGTNFLLYKGDPSSSHSLFAVLIEQPHERNLGWQTILTHHRVSQSVNKELLIVHIENPTGVCDKPSCIKNMSLHIKKVACKTNLMI